MAEHFNRRHFLKRSGMIAAIAGAAGAFPGGKGFPMIHSAMSQTLPRGGQRLRVLLFHDPEFPTVDCEVMSAEMLLRGLSSAEVRIVNAAEFAAALDADGFDLLVTAHGSAFPEAAGMPLLGCLARGRNWLQLGGVPLAVPVRRVGARWETTPRRTRWHRKLGLTQAFAVDCRDLDRWSASPCCEDLKDSAASLRSDRAFALYWRLSSTKYFPNDDGSAGTRDARLTPLISGLAEDGTPMIAAVEQLDWQHGDYAGGRWILHTGDRAATETLLAQLASLAGCGATDFTVSPGYARYRPGEVPSLRLALHRPRSAGEAECTVELLENGTVISAVRTTLRWTEAIPSGNAEMTLAPIPNGSEGAEAKARFLEIRVTASATCIGGLSTLETRSGFWIADDAAFEAGAAFTRQGSSLQRGGKPFAAAGTTYMAGDVQRNFLLEPNPWIWREDFAAMRRADINMLRTGIWYGWKRLMLEPGRMDEAAMRAMDAFLLTSIEYDIPVIFSFFAFLPESWGGDNPFLDPRAVAAQRLFIAAFARRYRGVPGLIWDLINEPSFCSPSQLWRCRPNYDRFEVEAWRNWLRGRLPDMDDATRLHVLIDRWRADSSEGAGLPALADFDDGNLFSDRQPLKVLDYRLFAQDAFAGWVRALSETIRDVDRAGRMIMVGQDEGGALDRPNPQFFADAVDISSVHSWWFNDDLLWDSIVTRAPGLPHLVQETGAMFYETIEGAPWRSEDESARLIERKLALAAGAGSAGFVQWLWNSNPYMPSDNEAAIGALRADGSAKPELAALRSMSRFLTRIAPSLIERREEDVVLVLPHADQFSVRGNGMRATRCAVRTMAYRCRIPLRAVSEYTLERDTNFAKLYVLPSPAVLTEHAWQQLLTRVAQGAFLLVTGVLDRDDNWRIVPRSALFDLGSSAAPVAQFERLVIDGATMQTGFRGDDLQRVEKAVVSGEREGAMFTAAHGKGRVLWCPVPVEMGDNEEVVEVVYRTALREAEIETVCRVRPDVPGVLAWVSRYRDAALLTVLSELSEDIEVRISLQEPDFDEGVSLPAGRAVLLLLDRKGHVLHRSDKA